MNLINGEKIIGNGEATIWIRKGGYMSYSNFEKAMELSPKCRFYTTAGGKTKAEIEMAEAMLKIRFSDQCRTFYEKYGYLSFYGNEIFGIDPNDKSGILEGNTVAYALNDRKVYGLPEKWLPIYNFNDGNMAYLDYSSVNSYGEPRVIMAFYNGRDYEVAEILAEDFGDFLLQLVEEQLE